VNRSLKGKVNKLENNVLQKPIVGTTKICTCAFPEPEQVLLEKARKQAEMQLSYEDATEQQRTIMYEAARILNFRVFDFFTMYLEDWCRGDPVARVVMHERLLWFVQELRKELTQQLEVSEIERNTPEDCEVDKVDEYFRKAPETFTPESYDKLSTEIFMDIWKKKKEKEKRKGEPKK